MSQKEVKRAQVLDLVKDRKISQQDASKRLGITTRQVRRLSKRYQAAGLPGLVSKKRGRASNRRLDEVICTKANDLIGTHYRDFGPTLACEKLAELHCIHLSVESTRQLMMQAGYWKSGRGGAVCTHPMRERRARFGELIQIDGSPHDWFEGRGAYCTLLVFIDDATGQLTQLRFTPTETTLGYMHVLHDHILAHGVPVALYSDKHSIFRINAKDADPEAETQFSRAARELGIECIHARSPQAKGRVERVNQTLQDRLVKEMRLAGINNMDSANAWLPGYIQDFNKRFAVAPKDTVDAHLAYPGTRAALLRTLSVQVTKTLSKNLSCQHENQLLQVSSTGTGLGLRGAKVTIHGYFDGSQELLWKKRKLTYSVMAKPQRQSPVADGKSVNAHVDKAMARRNVGHKPAPNHPWRKMSVGKSAHDGQRATP
ncbi:MAG: ISNCY family transposase [Gammaproteobacteria bacterium]|nr:ISNCY family transposase [Gammaproteobacteria bacterium]